MVSAPPTIGAVLLSVFFAIWLSSSAVHLTSAYLRRTGNPWTWVVAVVFLVLLNTAHTALLCYFAYDNLIIHFTDSDYLATATWDLTAHMAIFLAVSLVTQLYFCLRLSSLYAGQTRALLCGGIVFFTLTQLALGIAGTYFTATSTIQLYQDSLGELTSKLTLTSTLCSLLADLLIFGGTFKDMRTAGYTVRSENVVEVVSRLFVETNFTTLVAVLLSLAFYLAWDIQGHPSGVSFAFAIIIPKLSLVSMLASVNSGQETSRSGLDSRAIKHGSSLSDMFKGTPLNRMNGVTVSKIGTPVETPIANMYAREGGITPDQPGWLRRTLETSQPQSHLLPPSEPMPSRTPSSKGRAPTAISASIYPLDVFEAYERYSNNGHSSAIDVQEATPRKATFDRDEQGDVVFGGSSGGGGEKGGKSYGFF